MCPSTRNAPNGAPSRAAVSHFRPVFDVLDTDHDGKISYSDLNSFCSAFMGCPMECDAEMVGTMISVADLDRNGFVEYEEFEHVLVAPRGGEGSLRRLGGGVMEDVFRIMDKDGDGRLSHGDLRSYMESAGLEATNEDIRAMIRLGGGKETDGISFDGLLKILAV